MVDETNSRFFSSANGASKLKFGDHIYYSYEKPASQLPVLTSFLRAGLRSSQQCIHVADELPEKLVASALQSVGVNAEKELERGALRF